MCFVHPTLSSYAGQKGVEISSESLVNALKFKRSMCSQSQSKFKFSLFPCLVANSISGMMTQIDDILTLLNIGHPVLVLQRTHCAFKLVC